MSVIPQDKQRESFATLAKEAAFSKLAAAGLAALTKAAAAWKGLPNYAAAAAARRAGAAKMPPRQQFAPKITAAAGSTAAPPPPGSRSSVGHPQFAAISPQYQINSQGGINATSGPESTISHTMTNERLLNQGQHAAMQNIEANSDGIEFSKADKFKARMGQMFNNPWFQGIAPIAVSQIPVGSEDTVDENGRPTKRTVTLGQTSAGAMLPLGLMGASMYKGPLSVGADGSIMGSSIAAARAKQHALGQQATP